VGCQAPAAAPARWDVGLAWSWFDTELSLTDMGLATMGHHAVSASATRLFTRGWSLRGAAGATLGGSLHSKEGDGRQVDLHPGWQAAVQGAKRWRPAEGGAPFVSTSLAIAASRATTDTGALFASDLRLGLAVGWLVAGVWSPYLAGQVFGGPVLLTEGSTTLRATDIRHYRASVGSGFFLGEHASLFVDVAPAGELGLAGGATWRF
jgi:hypothetical protein